MSRVRRRPRGPPSRRLRSVRRRLVSVVVSALVLASCGRSAPGDVTVFAASSLTAAFTALAKTDPSLHATFDFGASSTLATQLAEGPADVFASADETNMRKVSSLVETPAIFARNRLEIAVAPGDPKHIASLADLSRPGLIVAICAPRVPCGTFAREAFAKAHVTVPNASSEENVSAVLTKVELGEADAGIVYTTDVQSAGAKVGAVPIPEADNIIASYPIAVVKDGVHRGAARAFERLVLSAKGQRLLRRFGFLPPA